MNLSLLLCSNAVSLKVLVAIIAYLKGYIFTKTFLLFGVALYHFYVTDHCQGSILSDMISVCSCLRCGNICKDPEGMACYRVLTVLLEIKDFNYHKSSPRHAFDIFLDLYVWLVRFFFRHM